MSNLPKTLIEIVDTSGAEIAHITREVRVNGTPVLLAENGFEIEYEHGEPTKVTLVLLPTEVRFNHAPKDSQCPASPKTA